ncbi:MAG TPA: sigma-54 dependent transcriptional regulator [Longimicrobiaceae bacterium]|nr:sigma-54 dependent transcriptional regulator [Longimicrobiaceae bacterium]
MRPVLAVLQITESFSEVWPMIAASLDAELRVACSAPELRLSEEVAGVVVAAGGREELADQILAELGVGAHPPAAVVGARSDYRLAVAVMRAGADDYFCLPDHFGEVRAWARVQVERAETARDGERLLEVHRKRYDFSQLVGASPALTATLSQASALIPTRKTVLVRGETGTGKELVARAIHFNGPRAAGPFVEVNCTALTESLLEAELFGYERGAFTGAHAAKPGLLEVAQGGTVFLDEIGDLSPQLQAKLLRFLEDRRVRRIGSVAAREVDVRVVAATHVDLERAVREGTFREDLYYRLSVVPLELPPLRERGRDVLLLARYFLQQESSELGIQCPSLTPAAQRALLDHTWPGNVRELRNSIERAAILFGGLGTLLPEHLVRGRTTAPQVQDDRRGGLPFPASLEQIERAAAVAAVEYAEGNKSRAARLLGIGRRRLYTLLGEVP